LANLSVDITLVRGAFELAVRREIALRGITALFGPSGSGKTSLLRVLAGLEDDARGIVELDGTVWQREGVRLAPHLRGIGYVFQDGRLFSHLTVEGNLRFALDRAARRGPAARSSRAIDFVSVVNALDLRALLPRAAASLSGGEQQRVAIGRALLTSPRLLLMDEPLSSLDAGRKREIIPHIEQLPARFGVPVLYVTHNVDEVTRLAADMLLMSAGRIVAEGRVADVLERLDLTTLTGGHDAGAVLEARVEPGRAGFATLRLREQVLHVPMAAAEPGSVLRIRIHARDVAIALERPQRLSIRNVLPARVLRVDAGDSVHVEVLLEVDGQRLRSRITRDALDELALEPGQGVFALIKSVALESTLL
jgi:molybdate transport system ATP-binding protein